MMKLRLNVRLPGKLDSEMNYIFSVGAANKKTTSTEVVFFADFLIF
jgi:hypothetical protein